ncbi:uncharacterized protein BDV14DRAFT_180857, partial [Aspergillus stella-maris]|uniref:uncharacterized protein n=1 Tax=Aspergillus stella-maris TaxID=1810926 RepID=UPI003CCD1E2A
MFFFFFAVLDWIPSVPSCVRSSRSRRFGPFADGRYLLMMRSTTCRFFNRLLHFSTNLLAFCQFQLGCPFMSFV